MESGDQGANNRNNRGSHLLHLLSLLLGATKERCREIRVRLADLGCTEGAIY